MEVIRVLADKYNNMSYFENDPVIFPRHFMALYKKGEATLQDVEVAGLLCAHLAWGKREMIVRDCRRLMDHMNWQPYNYIKNGIFKDDDVSIHRTITWKNISEICLRLKSFYLNNSSLEILSPLQLRTQIFGCKEDKNAANKKIHMFFRWMVRDDNIVDIGIWKSIKPADLIIPLDVHVHRNALKLGITKRKAANITTALEITDYLRTVFPEDPCKGDFALFAFSASQNEK